MTDSQKEQLMNLENEIRRLTQLQQKLNPLENIDKYIFLSEQLKAKCEERRKILEESKNFFQRIDPSVIAGGLFTIGGTALVLNYEDKVGPITSKAFSMVTGMFNKNNRRV